MATTTFQVNQTYTGRSVCDHQSIFSATIAKRTKTFVTTTEGKRFKIHQDDDVEFFFPEGRYSMAPVIKADRPA